jgi:hypothetical protein
MFIVFEFPDKPKGIFKKNKNCTINNREFRKEKQKYTSAGLNRGSKHSRSHERIECLFLRNKKKIHMIHC